MCTNLIGIFLPFWKVKATTWLTTSTSTKLASINIFYTYLLNQNIQSCNELNGYSIMLSANTCLQVTTWCQLVNLTSCQNPYHFPFRSKPHARITLLSLQTAITLACYSDKQLGLLHEIGNKSKGHDSKFPFLVSNATLLGIRSRKDKGFSKRRSTVHPDRAINFPTTWHETFMFKAYKFIRCAGSKTR